MMLATINNKFDDLDEFTTFRVGLDAYLNAVSTVLGQAPTIKSGLIELHASILRHACNGLAPKEHLAAAAVLFGLTQAVRQGRHDVPSYAVRNTVAYLVQATRSPVYETNSSQYLELARSWMAHAYLAAGVEGGDPR
ncbi:hypothetical protein [Amycolatopsis sp. NPDC051903]|uniref:hypothetical protein n=1 Tax=Amycolatopsis sp. NPDC051903 TaxID=3363936 RepID=UPI0037901067